MSMAKLLWKILSRLSFQGNSNDDDVVVHKTYLAGCSNISHSCVSVTRFDKISPLKHTNLKLWPLLKSTLIFSKFFS